jgi:hypothetical protein
VGVDLADAGGAEHAVEPDADLARARCRTAGSRSATGAGSGVCDGDVDDDGLHELGVKAGVFDGLRD